MKNLFDFATRELSQDAFLRWLFENIDSGDEGIETTCLTLLKEFTQMELDKLDKSSFSTTAQWQKIDVTVSFRCDGKNYLIAIEDKTGSKEHNQLQEYNQSLEKEKGYHKIFKIFYKTDLIDQKEKDRIDKAKWSTYGIFEIAGLLSKINASKSHPLLKDYIEHVKKLRISVDRNDPPSKWNDIAWHSFFNCYASKKQGRAFVEQHQHYYYTYLYAGNNPTEIVPCIEVRSKEFDAETKRLTARIVWYHIEDSWEASPEERRIQIDQWKKQLDDFCQKTWGEDDTVNYRRTNRKNPGENKQIYSITKAIPDNEESLKAALDEISKVLTAFYPKPISD